MTKPFAGDTRRPIRSLGRFFVCAFALALAGCSSSSPDGASAAGAPASGAGGKSASDAGAGGSTNQAGSNSIGGAGTGSNGTSGSRNGGGDGAVDVLDPTLPKPSHDCRTDTSSKTCISVSGTLNGMPIDLQCSLPDSPTVADGPPDAWLTGCRPLGVPGMGYFYLVSIPWQLPGTFDVVRTTNQTRAGVDEVLVLDANGVDLTTPNLVKAELAGTVEKDPAIGHTILTGTFRGSWDTPAASCAGNAVTKCYSAQINGTFRSDQIITFLDHP